MSRVIRAAGTDSPLALWRTHRLDRLAKIHSTAKCFLLFQAFTVHHCKHARLSPTAVFCTENNIKHIGCAALPQGETGQQRSEDNR